MFVRHDYQGDGDLRRMQSLVQRCWSPDQHFHIGDLAWGRHSLPGAVECSRISLWEREGEVEAWAWVELPGHVDLLCDPQQETELLPEMLDWFEYSAEATALSCLVMEGEVGVRRALEQRGFTPAPDGPFFIRHVRDLEDLPGVVLPDGFRVCAVGAGEAVRRAAAHRAGWSDLGSRVTAKSYAAVMACYPYLPETDLVVVEPGGDWVASALGWYDDANAVGLVEPVSCHPSYRRRRLGRAVDVALLHAFRDLGARSAVVLPRGDAGYPAPGRLYRGIGYQPGSRTVTYTRSAG